MTLIDSETTVSGRLVEILDAAPQAVGWIVRTTTREERFTVRADAWFKSMSGRYPRLRP